MPDILKQVDQSEKDKVLSLSEIEKAFDNTAKEIQGQKDLVNALNKNLSDDNPKYTLGFEYQDVIKKISGMDKNLSKIEEKDIKVYQLCKNLEMKKLGIDKHIEINGKIGTEIIADRIASYNDKVIGLISGSESLSYNKDTNELIVKTQFGEYKKIISGADTIIDNATSCKTFIDNERIVLFNEFLKKNTITAQEFETIALGVDKKININYKNENAYIEKSFSLDISAGISNENILKFIQEKRDEYKKIAKEGEEYMSITTEIDKENQAFLNDPYNNINLLMGSSEYAIFSQKRINIYAVRADNIGELMINNDGKLVVGDKEKPILDYDFSKFSVDNKSMILVNISNILKDFVNYYPDSTNRQVRGTIIEIQKDINQEKGVIMLYNNLMEEENVAKLKDGTLDLKSFNYRYRDKAFAYMMAEMKKNGQDISVIVKKRNMNSILFTFVNDKKDSQTDTDMGYKKLYYAFIKNKLGGIMKIDNAGTIKESRLLDETKINVVPSTTYKWLMFQKNANGSVLSIEEVNKKVVELTTKNKRLQGLTQEQQDILLKTDMGKGLLKSAIYNIEQKKYKAATDAFQAIPDDGKQPTSVEAIYKQKLDQVYYSIAQANKWLNGTAYQYIGSSNNNNFKSFQKDYPEFAKYLMYNKNKIMPNGGVGGFELNRDAAESTVFKLRQPFEEAWVQHMKNIHSIGLTQYIEWKVPGQTGKVNMAEVINNPTGKKIDSPYSDGYCKSKMNFGNGAPSEVVRDTNWEELKDWFSDKWDAIENDPLNGIASTTIDISGIIVGGVVAGVVGALPIFPPGSAALAFTLVDNAVKMGGYATLEGANYMAGTGEYKDVKDITFSGLLNATGTGLKEGANILQKETDVYGKTSRVKDAFGNVITKDVNIIITEKILELASSFILFGPVGKVGQMVEKSVFNKMVMNNLEKEFGEKAMSKMFTKEMSNIGSKDIGVMFGKDVVTGGVKIGSKATGFLAEVSTFTVYNAVSAAPSSFLVTLAETNDISKAQSAAESTWADSFSLVGLTTNFIHNVGFIGLLKGSNLLAEPISSKIMSSFEKMTYLQSKSKSESLGMKLDAQMKKDGVNFFTKEEIAANKDIKVNKAEVEKLPPGEEGGFFQKTSEGGYKYVEPTEIPKVTEINNQITVLKAKVASIMQSLAVKTEKIKDIEGIKNFNDFVIKNNLNGTTVTPEIILQKRIEYCKNKIETTKGTDKIKYENMLEKLNAQKTDLMKLREGYTKSLDLINIDKKGNMTIANQTKSEEIAKVDIGNEPANTIDKNNQIIDKSIIEDITKKSEQNYNKLRSKLEIKIQDFKDKLNKETDPKNQKELNDKIKEGEKDLKKIEKAYENLGKILKGELVMDDYVGIRDMGKKLGLNIETDMLPLTKKLVENTIRSKNPGKEVTQIEVDNYIRSQIRIDDTLGNILGDKFKSAEVFNTSLKANDQITSIIDALPKQSSELLGQNDIQILRDFSQKYTQTLKELNVFSEQQIFDITQGSIRKLIFQNIADKGLLSGSDHGILHIVKGNMFTTWDMISQIEGLNPQMKAKIKAMVSIMIVDHDIGYNMASFESMIKVDKTTGDYDKSKYFDATKDHPLYSRMFMEANNGYYSQLFGADLAKAMMEATLDHSAVYSVKFSDLVEGVNGGKVNDIQNMLQRLISSADCLGVTHIDKLHALFQHPNIMLILGKFEYIRNNFSANESEGIRLNGEVRKQMLEEVSNMQKNSEIDGNTANYYKNAIEKGMDINNKNGDNPNGFQLNFNFSSFVYAPGKIELTPEGAKMSMEVDVSMFNSVKGLYGDKVVINNLKKILEDYGSIEKISYNGNEIEANMKNLIEIVSKSKVGDKIVITGKTPGQKDANGNVVESTVSSVTFNVDIKTPSESNDIMRSDLDRISGNSQFINNVIKDLINMTDYGTKGNLNFLAEKALRKLSKNEPILGEKIRDIIENDAIQNKAEAIKKLRSENASAIYDKYAFETKNNVPTEKTGKEIDSNKQGKNDISEKEYQGVVEAENAVMIQEKQKITSEVQTNKDNPEKINGIISNLADKAKNASTNLINVVKSNEPMIQKTRVFIQALNKLLVTDHLMHEIKSIKTNYKDVVESINQKERYRLAGASTNLLVDLGIATAVTGKHIVDIIHGHMLSGLNINNSFSFAIENIKNVSGYIKFSFTAMEGQKSAYNKIQELGKVDMEKIYQNKDVYLSEYNTETKKLSSNLDKIQYVDMFGKFILDQKYDMSINDQTEVGDVFVHIINKMKGDIPPEEFGRHIKNINELATMINPDKTFSRNVYTMAKNVITGKVGNFNYNFDAVVEDKIGIKYREGIFN